MANCSLVSGLNQISNRTDGLALPLPRFQTIRAPLISLLSSKVCPINPKTIFSQCISASLKFSNGVEINSEAALFCSSSQAGKIFFLNTLIPTILRP